MTSEHTPDHWTGRDGAYGLGPNAPAPPWHPGTDAAAAVGPQPWMYYPPAGFVPAPPPRRRTGRVVAAGVALVAVAAAGYGVGVRRTPVRTVQAAAAPSTNRGSTGGGSVTNPFGTPQLPTSGQGSSGSTGRSGSGSAGSSTGAGTASAVQSKGIVDIDTQLGYQGEAGAGTGMVMSADGYVLTNNHVVDGATSIDATVVSTGTTYTATVVGTDPTKDVAVIKLSKASGLTAASFGSTTTVGAAVTGVGNAGGVGGTPSAAKGTVTALAQKLTASDDGANPEKLTGMIETNAAIIPGDSGGPLYDASNRIVGMDTAASSGGTKTQGYAIPIARARSIAAQIESGVHTSGIHLGYPGFLGIEVGTAKVTSGVPIASVIQGGAAQGSGLVAGDDITAVDGTAVRTATGLHNLVAGYHPGQRVTVTYTTAGGRSASTTLTLTTGPAD